MADSHEDGRENGWGESEGGISGFLRSLLSGIPWKERAEGEETVVLDVPPGAALRVDNANGRTRVIGEDRDDIQVGLFKTARAESEDEAQSLIEKIQLVARDESGFVNLEFDIPRRWNRRGRVDVDLRVPRDLRIEVLAANGKVCVSGMRAGVRARSSNGAVRVADVVGDVDIATSNAKVSAQCVCGRLIARSSNGKIHVDEHEGSVDASTSNGTIHCELSALGREGVVLATSNGRIVLELPEVVDGEVDIRVDNGVIRTNREVGGSRRERSGRVKGTLGGGGPLIKLRASNGTISLR